MARRVATARAAGTTRAPLSQPVLVDGSGAPWLSVIYPAAAQNAPDQDRQRHAHWVVLPGTWLFNDGQGSPGYDSATVLSTWFKAQPRPPKLAVYINSF